MKRYLYKSINLYDEGLRLDYYIITTYITCGKKSVPSYGAEIVQKPVSSECKLKDFSSRIIDITPSYGKIISFTDILSENAVDPSLLLDAVTDGLEEGIF